MTTGSCGALLSGLVLVLAANCLSNSTANAEANPVKAQITVLYDAFGKNSAMHKDWGYAALIDYGGKRILFDTGNNPDTLAENAKVKGVDLTKLDFVVMSHRGGVRTSNHDRESGSKRCMGRTEFPTC